MAAIDLSFINDNSLLSIQQDMTSEEKHRYLNLSSMAVFMQSPTGPVPVYENGEKPQLPTKSEQDMLKLGIFYSVAVGQGNCHSRGLFGPLPVLDSKFRCLLFANNVKDPEQKDPRMNGKSYLVTCFFYHMALDSNISKKREILEQIFLNYFQSHGYVDEVIDNLIHLKKNLTCFL
ncbi:MAG: hypothetical protein ACXADA_09760 [Candidatus Hodarchaeales archaeon]